MSTRLLLTAGIVALLAAPTAAAANHRTQNDRGSIGQTDRVADTVFSTVERRIIEEFFGTQALYDDDDDGEKKFKKGKKAKGLPPGLAKRSQLPPGLAKRDRLPPGLAKRDLPPGLASRLGDPINGTERLIVDNDLILVEAATGVVLDILKDVVTK